MIDILHEDNHLLVLSKPANLPTMGVGPTQVSLVTQAKAYMKQKYHKPGNVYLGLVSRLDAMVSGVIVLAKTSKAARRLTQQFRDRQVVKIYWAVVSGPALENSAACHDWLIKDDRARRMRTCVPETVGAIEARLRYRRLCSLDNHQLLEVKLETGRKHQIRVQLAHRKRPVLGDRKYGSRQPFSPGIALHSRTLELEHPVKDEWLSFRALLPASWADLEIPEDLLR